MLKIQWVSDLLFLDYQWGLYFKRKHLRDSYKEGFQKEVKKIAFEREEFEIQCWWQKINRESQREEKSQMGTEKRGEREREREWTK